MNEPVIYNSARQVSDCCWEPYFRMCWGGDKPDAYVCRRCWKLCKPIRETMS
jgi:hypothetical protein